MYWVRVLLILNDCFATSLREASVVDGGIGIVDSLEIVDSTLARPSTRSFREDVVSRGSTPSLAITDSSKGETKITICRGVYTPAAIFQSLQASKGLGFLIMMSDLFSLNRVEVRMLGQTVVHLVT